MAFTTIDHLAYQKTQMNKNLRHEKAVVLFSGGQDSTTVLHYAIRRHGVTNVLAIGFDYGQRHEIELVCADNITAWLDIPYKVIDLSVLRLVGKSALTGDGDVSAKHERLTALPASFVPARNALMLTLAHAYAAEHGASYVYGGMCQTDYSGYPDCRAEFIAALESTLNIGYDATIHILTPLMFLTKADTFALAAAMGDGVLDSVLFRSHTCYEGDRSQVHAWGHGCGKCPACKLRIKGYEEFVQRGSK